MKIRPTEPDIETIYSRVKKGTLDLQPDFQRAEVWKSPKKKLLIDTILREWQVPPVHVIYDSETCVQEVLDGQQRLSAIISFMNDEFRVNGYIEPHDDDIVALDNLRYSDLPEKVKNRFDRYSIRFFEITEYNQGEPGELFNRLNEALKLTSAEKRNAYVGQLRSQMKDLVNKLETENIESKFLGFSNQRLAYHDLFIKLCFLLENRNILAKYTEKSLNDRARDDTPFEKNVIDAVSYSIEVFGLINKQVKSNDYSVHITKASFFSWLFSLSDIYFGSGAFEKEAVCKSFLNFELRRGLFRESYKISSFHALIDNQNAQEIYELFSERSVTKVMTSSSLLIRDIVIRMAVHETIPDIISVRDTQKLRKLITEIAHVGAKECLEKFAEKEIIGEFL